MMIPHLQAKVKRNSKISATAYDYLEELLSNENNYEIDIINRGRSSQNRTGEKTPTVLGRATSLDNDSTTPSGKSQEENRKFSLKDSNGSQLTIAQAENFKDSKVRDENGSAYLP